MAVATSSNFHESYLAGHGFDITTPGLKTDYRSAALPTALPGPLNIWMDELGFYVPSTVFQSFRDDGRVNMKASVQ